MIDAHFDALSGRMTAVSGVYQYDTGQRLRLLGIPPPGELGRTDEYIDTLRDEAGNIIPDEARMPTLQVHYGHRDDSQTQMRLAIWEESEGAWRADIPDEYLQSCEPVYLYVYVYHGETQEETRARTMYGGVFTPICRPAPDNVATPEQWSAWAVMLDEIQAAIGRVQADVGKAQAAQEAAHAAKENAKEPTLAARDAAQQVREALAALENAGNALGGMDIEVISLDAGSAATAEIKQGEQGKPRLALGVPAGADGAKGVQGDTGPADCTITFDDGALTIITN